MYIQMTYIYIMYLYVCALYKFSIHKLSRMYICIVYVPIPWCLSFTCSFPRQVHEHQCLTTLALSSTPHSPMGGTQECPQGQDSGGHTTHQALVTGLCPSRVVSPPTLLATSQEWSAQIHLSRLLQELINRARGR